MSLVEKDGWEVFMNGRIQTFANYNEGQGRPPTVDDSTGRTATATASSSAAAASRPATGALPEFKNGQPRPTPTDQGLVREMRIRSGFTGNVLGFGIKKRLSEQTEILGYTAVTVGIDSEAAAQVQHRQPRLARELRARHAPSGAA